MRLVKRRLIHTLLAVLLTLGCVACGPEDGRVRGAGSGADGGNKPERVVPQSKVFSGQAP